MAHGVWVYAGGAELRLDISQVSRRFLFATIESCGSGDIRMPPKRETKHGIGKSVPASVRAMRLFRYTLEMMMGRTARYLTDQEVH